MSGAQSEVDHAVGRELTPSAAPRGGGRRYPQIAGLVAASAFSAFSFNVYNASLPLYLQDSRGLSVEAVGVLVGLAFVPQLLSPVFAGPLINLRGPRLAIGCGAVVSILANGLFLVTGSASAIGLARLLQGVAFALIVPATYALLPHLFPGRFLSTATGAFGTVASLALAVGPPAGLGLLRISSTALFAGALVSGALALVGSLALPMVARGKERHRLVALDVRWLPFLSVTLLTVVYWGIVTAYLPLHVPAAMRGSVGWYFTADAVAVLVMRVPAGYLAGRHGPRRLMVAGIVLAALATLVLLWPASTLLLVLSGIGTGAGAAFLYPPILIELSALSGDHNRGSAMSLYTSVFATGIALGSLVGAPIVGHLGFDAALLLSVAAGLAALPIAALSTDHRRLVRPYPVSDSNR